MAGVEDAIQSLGKIGGLDLGGIAGADGVDPVGKDAAGLEIIGTAVEFNELRCKIARIDAEHILDKFKGETALKGDVMDGEQIFYPVLQLAAVLGMAQHGQHRGVPVVAVDHVGLKVQVRQRFKYGAGEVGILFPFHRPAHVDLAAEIILVVNKINNCSVIGQAFDTHIGVSPTEPDAKIEQVLDHGGIFFLDAAVIGRDNARVHAAGPERFRQGTHHIRKAAGL